MGELFASPKDLCRLSLVLPQVWLWIMLRAIDQCEVVSNIVFYAAESGMLLVVLLGYIKKSHLMRCPRSQAISWAVAVMMAVSPICTLYGSRVGAAGISVAGTLVGGAALIWTYAEYFAECARLEPRRAVSYVLLSFAVVPVVRLPLDMLPVSTAVFLVAPLPLLYVLTNYSTGVEPAAVGPASVQGFTDARDRLVRVLAELAAFGFAMGFLRFDAQGIHDNSLYVLVNFAVKVALPLAALFLISCYWQLAGVESLCQTALVILLVLMVLAANLPNVPGVSFFVFDVARYAMVLLLFLALTALMHRTSLHPCALFAAGMGAYTVALTAGMAVAALLGLGEFSQYPPVLVLDVMCMLAVTTVLAVSMGHGADLHLFADGESSEPDVKARADELDDRCASLADVYGLTRRELETMQLICRGRSKRYIAEHMALSENTVRCYAKTLYAKLDVHSREELLDLLEHN